MTSSGIWIQQLDCVHSASDAELVAAAEFGNRLRAETHPDEQPASVEEVCAALRNIPVSVGTWPWWLCRTTDGGVVGDCHLFAGTGANAHVLIVNLSVQRECRRRGLATGILRQLADVAAANDRTVLHATTSQRVPAGAVFCERLGATPIGSRHTNRLALGGADRGLVERWAGAAPTYRLTAITGACPDDQIEDLAQILRMINDDDSVTAERIRQAERMDQAARATRWLALAREPAGTLAGLTEILWYANNPRVIQQRWTFVHPEHRRRGLGRTLKATMLRRIFTDAGQAAYVDTGNDDSNQPMLAINRALGFRPPIAEATWQLELDGLRAYLR